MRHQRWPRRGTLWLVIFGVACSTSRVVRGTVVGLDRTGAVVYGMSLAALERALAESLSVGDSSCDFVMPKRLPAGVSVMVVSGQVARVDVDTTGVLTVEGIGVGSTEADVYRAYPGLIRTEKAPYEELPAHALILTPRDTSRGMVFETDGHVVTNYRVGRRPEVEWIEGCS